MDLQHDDETGALQAWVAGDGRGYDALVARYAGLVYARCRRALGAADADDATQAVFLILARRRDQAVASPALAAWLLRVAENVVRNARRDNERRRRAEAAAPALTPNGASQEHGMDGIQDHLDACLAELPAVEGEAVRLHLLAGHTLAEVAAHTGAPLSTVHARVQRGLAGLRTRLARRGVTASGAALLACLVGEAAAAPPSSLLVHLRDLNPAAGGTGAAAAPSARALLWSQSRTPLMLRVSLAAAGLLIVGVAAVPVLRAPAAAAAAVPPATAAPSTIAATAADAAPPPTPAPEPALDPERTRWWYVARVNDGARSVARLRALPEAAFLPAAAEPLLAEVASLRSAALAVDALSHLRPETRVKLVREQLAQAGQTMDERMRQVVVKSEQLDDQDKALLQWHVRLPSALGWIEAASDDAPILGHLRALAGRPQAGEAPLEVIGKPLAAWNTGAENPARLTLSGRRLDLRSDAGHPGTSPDALPASALAALDTQADVELRVLVDGGRGAHIGNRMDLTIAGDGLRLSARSTWDSPVQAERQREQPRIPIAVFDRIPADAVLAAGVAVRPGSVGRSELWVMVRELLALAHTGGAQASFGNPGASGVSVQVERTSDDVGGSSRVAPEHRDLVRATALAEAQRVRDLFAHLDRADGHCLAFVQPGAPLPTVSLTIDLAEAPARALIAATGLPVTADGGATTTVGMAVVQLGWRDGRLIVTTRADGIASVELSGGFTAHAEVRAAIAALPDGAPTACLLLRPAALVAQVRPFAALALDANQQARLADYQQRLDRETACGFLSVSSDAAGLRLDARGLLAFVAGGMLSQHAAQAVGGLQAPN